MTRTFGRAAFVAALLAGASTGAMAQTLFDAGCTGSTATNANCFNGGGSTLALHVYADNATSTTTTLFPAGYPGGVFYQYTTVTAAGKVGYRYIGAGSGAGQSAFLNNNPNILSSTESGYNVEFGASDSFVTATNGQVLSNYVGANKPMATGGQWIQFPMIATPITIPVKNPKTTFNGEAAFNDTDLCGIFSGLITNWKSTSHGFNLTPGNIDVYWRNDNGGSGTTFLLTQHLNAVCTSANTASSATFKGFTATTKFATQFIGYTGPASGDTTTLWTIPTTSFKYNVGAKGSGGVAAGVLGDATVLTGSSVKGSAIGYLSPDYTAIASNTANANLYVAALINKNDTTNTPLTPTLSNVSNALQNSGFTAPATLAAAQIQSNWVPAIATPAKGYPIVGYTNLELAQCYKNATVAAGVKQMLGQLLTGTYTTYIQDNGFVPTLSSLTGLGAAVNNAFITNNTGTTKWNLDINNATACKNVTPRA